MLIMIISFWGYTFFSILANIFVFFNEPISQILLTISSLFLMFLLFLFGRKIGKKFNVNFMWIFYIALFLALFSLLPLYLTSSYFTYFVAQFMSFLFILLYLKVILSIIKSKKSIFKFIVFSILTLGIYSYFFFYDIIKEIRKLN
ncbi:DUF4234 domain-containing protein [Thermosipho globiformans]|uniref:DUF4234 domain-containing protein n=1 Tax=Thermosipho globiformans TaxID=380685 RepID=UPI001F495893|nr:DUF4234 domain-containing protein [Thermosipho globiformans]